MQAQQLKASALHKVGLVLFSPSGGQSSGVMGNALLRHVLAIIRFLSTHSCRSAYSLGKTLLVTRI